MARLSLSLLAAAALAAHLVAAWPCSPAQRALCAAPPGGLPLAQVPQFITITWDDAVDPQSYSIVQSILGGLKQRNGCGVPSTYFVTAQNTIPSAVQALYLAGNEIATHTLTHVGYPSPQEIVGCRDWLANATGIPRKEINGFRAPFLLSNAQTRRTLQTAGFLYDSSIPDTTPSLVSRNVYQRTWPYSMAGGIPQRCDTGQCQKTERYNLLEIPLWAVADGSGRPIASMDPPGDAYLIYMRELKRRLAGNRAPLGMFFHAGMESSPERIAQLRRFIQDAASMPGVFFCTNQQLLAWMQAPVPVGRMANWPPCTPPAAITGQRACRVFVGDCEFGSWDARRCRCKCLAEGTPGGYCRDKSGKCSRVC